MNAAALQADAMARVTWLKDQWLHHFGETLKIQRAGAAQSYGLVPEQYVTPLPGSVSNIFYGPSEAAPSPAVAPAPAPSVAAPPAAPATAPQTPFPAAVTTPQNVGAPLPAPPAAVIAAGEGFFVKALPWLLTAAMGTGGLGALGGYLLSPKTTPTAAQVQPVAPGIPLTQPTPVGAAPKPQEWEIKYKIGADGKWQTQVAPIAPEQ